MTALTVSQARWFSHVNGVNPPFAMRHWLTDRASLTGKLSARCRRFQVRRLQQRHALCMADEYALVAQKRRSMAHKREVLLQCDGLPVVFAHTIVPLAATAADWPFFSRLGERSLGTTLFGDPRVSRGTLQFARLRSGHPLHKRAIAAIGSAASSQPLFARRCLFRRKNGLLLVTEVFLPALQYL